MVVFGEDLNGYVGQKIHGYAGVASSTCCSWGLIYHWSFTASKLAQIGNISVHSNVLAAQYDIRELGDEGEGPTTTLVGAML